MSNEEHSESDSWRRIWVQSLVIGSQAGEDGRFAELVGHFDRRLREFVFGLGCNGDEVEDVVQEVWIEVYRNLYRLRAAGAFWVWVRRIARNRVYGRQRRGYRFPGWWGRTVLGTEVGERAEDLGMDLAGGKDTEEELGLLEAGLKHLTGEQRRLLRMKYWEKLNYSELAMRFGCPVGTIRSRLHYAKLALRREILKLKGKA